jgi:acetolactate synthase-1/2/3 large subunit
MRRTGAQIVWEMLEHEGVDVAFGIPGGAIMHTYHPRQDYNVHHILMREKWAWR